MWLTHISLLRSHNRAQIFGTKALLLLYVCYDREIREIALWP